MNTPHLTAGSVKPTLIPGKLRVYATRFSSFAQRVLLELEYKNIPYDVVFVNLKNKPEWFVKISPLEIVPVIELANGETLYGSLIVGNYLEEAYPERKLYPTDPLIKAKDQILIERFTTVESSIYELYKNGNVALFEKVLTYIDEFNSELKKRGKTFYGGDKPGMIDFVLWPIFERFDVLRIIKGDKFTIQRERFVNLFQWGATMKKEPSVKVTFLESEVHAKFIKTELAGKPDFDLLY